MHETGNKRGLVPVMMPDLMDPDARIDPSTCGRIRTAAGDNGDLVPLPCQRIRDINDKTFDPPRRAQREHVSECYFHHGCRSSPGNRRSLFWISYNFIYFMKTAWASMTEIANPAIPSAMPNLTK